MFNQIKNKLFKINNLWWLSVFIILVFFHSSHDLNNDEGIILNGAWNLLNGRERVEAEKELMGLLEAEWFRWLHASQVRA